MKIRQYYLAAMLLPFVLLGLLAPALAQVAPPQFQQSATRQDAAQGVALSTNFDTVNTQGTATITPPGGLSVYITGLSFEACEDATGGAVSNVNFTSTNISGAPQWSLSMASAASTCQRWQEPLATPLKSTTPGTAVTVVSPSGATHTGFGIRVYYYIAQ